MGSGASSVVESVQNTAIAGGPSIQGLVNTKLRSLEARETHEDRVERYIKSFNVSAVDLRTMVESFVDELQVGMKHHQDRNRTGKPYSPKECSFMMIDSYVSKCPSKDMTGIAYAIDLGGTNLRVLRVVMLGDGKSDVTQKDGFDVIPMMDPKTTATQFFDFIVAQVKALMLESGDINAAGVVTTADGKLPVGFAFSFPVTMTAIDKVVLKCWSKRFATARATNDPVEGRDVVLLLNDAFARAKVNVTCAALVNDTIGTFLASTFTPNTESSYAMISLIIGTGFNVAYREKAAAEFDYIGEFINVECGGFDRKLPLTNVDLELDFQAVDSRGRFKFEKMISGPHLAELCRRTIIKIYQSRVPQRLWQPWSLTTADAAAIAGDASPHGAKTREIVAKAWQVELEPSVCVDLHRVCRAVFRRSAAMAAVAACGSAERIWRYDDTSKPSRLSVGVDGSVYTRNDFYQADLLEYVISILGGEKASRVVFVPTVDGSGRGVAFLAKAISSQAQ